MERVPSRFLMAVWAACMLMGCDTTDDAGPCVGYFSFVDTLFVETGGSRTLDLDAVFGEHSNPTATYAIAHGAGPVQLGGERGATLIASATTSPGTYTVIIQARGSCGVLASMSLVVGTIPHGSTCTVPAAGPEEPVRLAVGGRTQTIPLWGEGGLVNGAFFLDAPAAVEGGQGIDVHVVLSEGRRRLRVTPGDAPGPTTARILASDACLREVDITIQFELLDTPACLIPPADHADFFPLEIGREWHFRARYQRPEDPPVPGVHLVGDEYWRVMAATPCDEGAREITLRRTLVWDGSNPSESVTRVISTDAVLQFDYGQLVPPGTWPIVPRYNPVPPDSVVIDGLFQSRATLRSDVGFSRYSHSWRQFSHNVASYHRILVSTTPPFP